MIKNNKKLNIQHCSLQGARNENEDEIFENVNYDLKNKIKTLAIFDGHGGN